jgi:ribosomal protein L14
MILKGSIVNCFDNSGCGTLKVIQLYSKQISHAGELIRGVLHKFDPLKNKLQRKKHYTVICIGVKQYTFRRSDYLIRFTHNKILMLADNGKKLLSTRVFGPVQREIKLMLVDSSVMHKVILLSRYII